MKPLVLGAVLAAVLMAAAALAPRAMRRTIESTARVVPSNVTVESAPCPVGSLPDNGVCVPLPAATPRTASSGSALGVSTPGETIGRWPDRPADIALYQLPVEAGVAKSGLSHPTIDDDQIINITGNAGDPVHPLWLEGQIDKTKIVSISISDSRVITLHAVRHGERSERYLLIYDHLGSINTALLPGQEVDVAQSLGVLSAADNGAPLLILSAYRLRHAEGQEPEKAVAPLDAKILLAHANSAPCDLRNVLPLRR
ncbi:MAG TPA: hypothetical protein VL137_11025 [Polyangiaceae bacterium]|nr:hypothetical protein [Polyangiaceae bacterium]